MKIPFNKPYITGNEIIYMEKALHSGKQSGNYHFSSKVKELMKLKYGLEGVFLTPSCTAALEMGALLCGIQPGDEVIMPSYTFSSTANSVLIFGGVPIFCEVNPRDMNIDVSKIESLITPKTKMIIPIDYAGVPCDKDVIMRIADKYNLIVMQDCAQSYGSLYNNEISGKKPHLARYSFHETKNYSCGEGGALVVNEISWRERASFIMEKGTDRNKVIKGIQNRYSWIDKGSSYLLSDILAAMLLAQLEAEEDILCQRHSLIQSYRNLFLPFQKRGVLTFSQYQDDKIPNSHAFWVIFSDNSIRKRFIDKMEKVGISAYIGYVPLHSSKMGGVLGYSPKDLHLTDELASRLVRMPVFAGILEKEIDYILEETQKILKKIL